MNASMYENLKVFTSSDLDGSVASNSFVNGMNVTYLEFLNDIYSQDYNKQE